MRARALLTPRWIAVHLGVLVLVAGFLALGWWQVGRARAGNLLSFGYALEWPVFAGFVVWMWIIEMRKATAVDRGPGVVDEDQTTTASPRSTGGAAAGGAAARRRSEAAYDDSDDPALRAYNHYLAWLNADPSRTSADYPGMPTKVEET